MGYALKISSANFSSVAVGRVTYIDPIPCTGISLSDDTITVECVEDTFQLTATITPSITTDELIWSSSDENIATVVDGLVTVHGIGAATITATCGDQTATASVVQTSIKAQFAYYVVNGKYCGANEVTGGRILGGGANSSSSIGAQVYHNTDDLRIRNGELESYNVECIRVPYGATKVNIDTTGGKPNYIEVVDTTSILTVGGVNYPEFIKNKDFPFANGSYAVEYGQAFAFRGITANIEAVNCVYFE